jgi:chromate transporter
LSLRVDRTGVNRAGQLSQGRVGSAAEVFATFLKLGLTSFGGPIAHLGYFHRELVTRRRWLDEAHYAQLVALCQLLPGPASSQLGFAMGLLRAGWGGGIAAFAAFTLPSALLLFGFAKILHVLAGSHGQAALHGLKLLAVAVVAQGVLVMARKLTPDTPRVSLAVIASALVILVGGAFVQLAVVALGAAFGFLFLKGAANVRADSFQVRYGSRTGAILLLLFAILLLIALVYPIAPGPLGSVAAAFYRSGALVFGGGHVVLPLMQHAVVDPGWLSTEEFLAGYGAAQAVPGPLFSVAAFLGERLEGGHGGILGATVALVSIFLPGLLLVAGSLPLWHGLARRAGALSAISGVNAAVVGLLAAALYDPLWTSAIHSVPDFAIALVAFVALVTTRISVLAVLAGCVVASLVRVVIAG